MYTDVPRFKRCCFCFPLRYSLLIWGCFTLGLSLFLVYFMADILHDVVYHGSVDESMITMQSLMIVLCVSEVVARSLYVVVCIILIIAALKKHEKLFRFVYFCSIVDLVFLFVSGIYMIAMKIHISTSVMPMSTEYIVEYTIRDIITVSGAMLIEGYTVLLIRSEVHKLQERSKIQFTNSATEAKVVVDTLEIN